MRQKQIVKTWFSPTEIQAIEKNIANQINRTPLYYAEKLSKITGNNIWLKLENLQKTGSFKLRGALNKIRQLDLKTNARIIAASAGNHAQGVALAASNLGIEPIIVMPENAPIAKIQATSNYGGKVILHGKFFDDALQHAKNLAKKENITLVHAFDDLDVIKGQATIGQEIYEDLQEIDYLLAPIGGGGLMSGVSGYLKQVNPKIKIIGVESQNINSYQQALKAKKVVPVVNALASVADGIAVKSVSPLTYDILNQYVDDVVTVSEDQIAEAMLFLLEKCKFVTEGAGAVSAAVLLFDILKIKGQNKNIVAIISGGNVDITTLGNIINHALLKSKRRIVLSVNSPIGNKSLVEIINVIQENGAQIFKINTSVDRDYLMINSVNIKLIIDVFDYEQEHRIIQQIEDKGYQVYINQGDKNANY